MKFHGWRRFEQEPKGPPTLPDDTCPLRPPVRFTRYSPILPHTFTRGLQSGGSIAFYLHKSKEVEIRYEHCPTCRPKNNSPAAVTRDRTACRQHDLRHGAARRIPAALLSHLTLRRLGLGRGRSLARRSAPCLSRKCRQTCSKPRREAAPFAARQTLGSNSSNSTVAGSSIGRYF